MDNIALFKVLIFIELLLLFTPLSIAISKEVSRRHGLQ